MKYGLSLEKIEELYIEDIRTIPSLIECTRKIERIERLKDKLMLAEAFQFSYVGAQHDPQHRNASAYSRWQKKIEKEINKLYGIETENIWDKLRKSRRV